VPATSSAAQLTRPARRTSITGRAAMLAVVVCVLVLSLVYPARQLIEQRQRAAELSDRINAQEDRVRALEEQKARWADPAYVKAQARQRLHFVLPGETSYVVIAPRPAPPKPGAAGGGGGTAGTWYGRLWSSVQRADQGPPTGR
jgi:cell division protein FtsB